jgi:hypothetical protein
VVGIAGCRLLGDPPQRCHHPKVIDSVHGAFEIDLANLSRSSLVNQIDAALV